MNDYQSSWDKCIEEYNRLSFGEKCRISSSAQRVSVYYTHISYDGFVTAKDRFAVTEANGDAYVYMWKHLVGDVFYVGSGVRERWKVKNRSASFLKEIDKGDAVVYKVLDGVDRETAFIYERYISCSLSEVGYNLCNRDNSAAGDKKKQFEAWKKKNYKELKSERCKLVEHAVIDKILLDRDFSWTVFLEQRKFLEEYGEHYFSEYFSQGQRQAPA